MSTNRRNKRKLPPFVPLLKDTIKTEAWKALSHGARSLYAVHTTSIFRMRSGCPRAMPRKSLGSTAHAATSCAGFASCSITASSRWSVRLIMELMVTAGHLIGD